MVRRLKKKLLSGKLLRNHLFVHNFYILTKINSQSALGCLVRRAKTQINIRSFSCRIVTIMIAKGDLNFKNNTKHLNYSENLDTYL